MELNPFKSRYQDFILAGGDADSLHITETGDYRPLLPINDKTLIEHVIDKIIAVGFHKIIVIGE